VFLVPDVSAVFVEFSDELLHVTGSVETVPHDLPVVGVVGSTEALFIPVLPNGDAAGVEQECGRILKSVHVVVVVQPSRIVVVAQEVA